MRDSLGSGSAQLRDSLGSGSARLGDSLGSALARLRSNVIGAAMNMLNYGTPWATEGQARGRIDND